MAGISLRNSLEALNANRMLGINASSRAKSTEKLSSGYKINRAADDAAGLAISEKMRKLIRGLNQGTYNAQDGVSWVQIGDGALEEAQDMIKRMSELTIKSLNGTNSSSDRAALEAEFEQLKEELDRVGKTTEFNEMNIFSEHKPLWHRCNGDVKWEPDQVHVVTAGQNELSFMYRETEASEPQIMTITVPPGEYSTVELLDEIDDAIAYSMSDSIRFFVEYNKNGYVDATLEGGAMLDCVFGGLSYLLYDMYKGGTMGALIGTTIFSSEAARLDIVANKNDSMSFTIEYFDGRVEQKSVSLNAGRYTRSQLIDLINAQLTGSSVEASAYGTGIKLGSSDTIVTGFKGNMFRIDGADYTSVFYDNVHYGSVSQYHAVFRGGYVLNTDARDVEHAKIKITDNNNVLTLQPNRRDTPIDLVIDKGEYTMEELAGKLNALFQANNLELKASVISQYASVGDTNVPFRGLEIRSELKGPDSLVNVDRNSSAFDTLFVTRNYNEYGSKAQVRNETTADKDAWFRGSRDLVFPLTLSSGNDTFQIAFKNTDSAAAAVTLQLRDGQYNSMGDLIAEINAKIGADSVSSGKLLAKEENGRIRIDGVSGQEIDNVTVKAFGSDNGFDTLFQGYIETVYHTSQSGSSIVLPGTASSDSMNITVDGKTYTVKFPSANPTQDEIKKAIEDTIQANKITAANNFGTVSGKGSSSDRNFSAAASGSESVTPWSDTASGSSQKIEGMVGFEYNYPAVLELGPQLRDVMVINSGNNNILLTVGDENGEVTKVITIPSGTYNQQSLEGVLRDKINEAFGADKGITVSRNGNKITLTSKLPEGMDGGRTSIKCGTGDSSFLKYLNTKESPAVCASTVSLAPSITIAAGSNQFTFQYTAGGSTRNITLNLDAGNYTPSSIVAQIQTQLNKTGTGIQASLSNSGQLVLTSAAAGSGASISYHTSTAGSAMEALYGPLTGASPANIVVPGNIQSPITIPPGGQDFSIIVNGTKETVTLDGGTYDRNQFLTMLNSKLSAKKVEAYLSGNRLGFRTVDKGPGASLKMEYHNGGSSMESIYGFSTTMIPGVKAEWDNGSLKLTAVDTNGNEMKNKNVYVSSAASGGLLPPTVVRSKRATANSSGYHSRKYSIVDGANLNGPVTIDQWNNDLKFRYTENGTNHDVSITVSDKASYTYAELQAELQGKIDAAVGGSGKVTVTVDQYGVAFTAVNKSSQYQFTNLSGDFYQNVMCACAKKSSAQNFSNKDGSQIVQKAYVVGRKDIKTQPVEINKGVSDELSLDLTYAGTVHKIQVTLDPGRYSSEDIKRHLQQKIDEKLVDMGMKAGLIQVGVGGISSGVAGGNDQKALNFSLSDAVAAPGEGDYIIDGVSGNAAFELFYQTDGKMVPSYIMGTKDVTNGVAVKPGETELSVCVDGKVYHMELREGPYTADELIDELNDKLIGAGAPLSAYVDFDTGRVKLAHKLMDAHDISWVSGSAKDEIFFEEAGDWDDLERRVQLSDDNPDYIELKRSEFSASLVGIRSLCITKIKYATKAVDRLSSALEKISALRSTFGSTQNRLEHSINNNRNKAENLQSAESKIRDTDMAKEMVRQASYQILHQAGISVLTQANQSREMILGLLQ